MIGASLSMKKWFQEGASPEEKARDLALIRSWGVESVELRTVRPDTSPEAVLDAAKLIWRCKHLFSRKKKK